MCQPCLTVPDALGTERMSETMWCSLTACSQRKHGSCAQVQCANHTEVLYWLQIERAGDTRHSLREEAAAVLAAVLQASVHLQTAQSCAFTLMVRQNLSTKLSPSTDCCCS